MRLVVQRGKTQIVLTTSLNALNLEHERTQRRVMQWIQRAVRTLNEEGDSAEPIPLEEDANGL